MVRYLIIKAKHRHALQEHECLIGELRAARVEQNYWYDKKEELLDEVLKVNFGYVLSLCEGFFIRNLTVYALGLKRNHYCEVRRLGPCKSRWC
jgi:hypothetical protein